MDTQIQTMFHFSPIRFYKTSLGCTPDFDNKVSYPLHNQGQAVIKFIDWNYVFLSLIDLMIQW